MCAIIKIYFVQIFVPYITYDFPKYWCHASSVQNNRPTWAALFQYPYFWNASATING
jgi:hypothetical protein